MKMVIAAERVNGGGLVWMSWNQSGKRKEAVGYGSNMITVTAWAARSTVNNFEACFIEVTGTLISRMVVLEMMNFAWMYFHPSCSLRLIILILTAVASFLVCAPPGGRAAGAREVLGSRAKSFSTEKCVSSFPRGSPPVFER